MESLTPATQLRNLLFAHDKAVFLIYTLDLEVFSLMKKMAKQVEDGHIIHGIKLAQRRCVLEGVKEMFSHYRHNKWREVQACISAYIEDGQQQQHTDVSHEDLGSHSRTGDQYITSDSLQEDQLVGVVEHQLRGDMLEHSSQRSMEDHQMQSLERRATGQGVWSQQQNNSQQHQGQHHQLQHQDHVHQHERQAQDPAQDHRLQHQYQRQDHLLQNQDETGLLYWNQLTQTRVEENIDDYISSDNESSMDLSYDDDLSEQEEDDGSIYCHGSYNQYMETITRGLCLENCELHRCA